MVHTVHIIESGVVHKLEKVPNDVAKAILNWWVEAPNEKGLIPEYFLQVIKEGEVFKRAIGISRSNIAAIDVVPEEEAKKGPPPPPA